MEWNALLKDVGGRFKHRSWLLIDLAPEALVLSDLSGELVRDYLGVTLILDCHLEGVFRVIDGFGPGVSYAASLQAARGKGHYVTAVLPGEVAFQDFKWAC
ncbi:hypothetical protein AYK59_05475 [Pseudomonas synxantha]|uniref:hypothetical protein n=1 Tax=Pseudomonas synxantha TaxID=47883 RepID=UPI00078E2208|nr:hypothetical protein [Pseudomonas synxantha]AMS19589.1 hypothetical protein AYK59_05475 [Pseudomonas synxantha]